MTFWKNKRILLTGGVGFLGSHIVENLIWNRNVPENRIIIPSSKNQSLRKWENCKTLAENADIILLRQH